MLLPVQGVLCAGDCLSPADDSREGLRAAKQDLSDTQTQERCEEDSRGEGTCTV